METAMMLAKIFGPFLAIWGLWMLLYGDNVVKIMTSMKNSPACLYCSAMINLFLGVYVIVMYNMWDTNIFLFITLLGWALFLRGLLGLFMPQMLIRCMSHSSCMRCMGIVPFVWGLILVWAGYYMM